MPNETTRLTHLAKVIKEINENEHRDELIKLIEEQLIDDAS